MAILAWDDTDTWDNATDTWDGTNLPPGDKVRAAWKFNRSMLKGGDELKLGGTAAGGVTITTPHTWVHEEPVSAALLNREIRDRLNQTFPALAQAAGDLFYSDSAHHVARLPIGPLGAHLKEGPDLLPQWSSMPELIGYREFSAGGTYARTPFPGSLAGLTGPGFGTRTFAIVPSPGGGNVAIDFVVPASGAIIAEATWNSFSGKYLSPPNPDGSLFTWFALADGGGSVISGTQLAIGLVHGSATRYRMRVSGLDVGSHATLQLASCVSVYSYWYQSGTDVDGIDYGPLTFGIYEA